MKKSNEYRITKLDTEFYRQKILFLLRNDKEKLAKNLIIKIAKEEYLDKNDIEWLYNFFSPIFDAIFYEIMFEKIRINNRTKTLLEILALPLWNYNDSKRRKILSKIR